MEVWSQHNAATHDDEEQTMRHQIRRIDEWAVWNEETDELSNIEVHGPLIDIPDRFVDCIAAGEPTDDAIEWMWEMDAGTIKPLAGSPEKMNQTDYSRWENENGEELWMDA